MGTSRTAVAIGQRGFEGAVVDARAPQSSADRRAAEAGRLVELEALFTAHWSDVYESALRITGNAMDAEDALQAVFMRLLGGPLDHVPPAGDGRRGYLRRAGINAGLDVVRARARRSTEPLDTAPAAVAGPGGDPALLDHVRRSLATMSPRAAAMFALQEFEGYAQREIAALFGTTESVVAVTIHRARVRLRADVAGFLGEDA